jgi:drug/metabolite transporter (DMT)-like permease
MAILTAIWGYCNIVIRQLEFSLSPAAILVVRYLVIGIAGLPLLWRGPAIAKKRLLQGLGVGVFLAAATLSQARGMESIPVDNVAFITALYVVLTPLFMALWRRRRPHRIVAVAAVGSILGVALLVGHLTFTVAAGTVWSLLAAIWATAQIVGTTELSRVMTTMQLTIVEALGAGLALGAFSENRDAGDFRRRATADSVGRQTAVYSMAIACPAVVPPVISPVSCRIGTPSPPFHPGWLRSSSDAPRPGCVERWRR